MPIGEIAGSLLKSAAKNGSEVLQNGAKTVAKNGRNGVNGYADVVKDNAIQKSVARRQASFDPFEPPRDEITGLSLDPQIRQEESMESWGQILKRTEANRSYAQNFGDDIESVVEDPMFNKYVTVTPTRITNVIEDKVTGIQYREGAERHFMASRETSPDGKGSLSGYPKYTDPKSGEETHFMRINSQELSKKGKPQLKTRAISGRNREHAARKNDQAEQTAEFDKTSKKLIHHRSELSLFRRIAAGLSKLERKKFFREVRFSERWPNLFIGDGVGNMQGLGHSDFFRIHKRAHDLLNAMGLNPKHIDFTGADMETRRMFVDALANKLQKVDEFIYNELQALKSEEYFSIDSI